MKKTAFLSILIFGLLFSACSEETENTFTLNGSDTATAASLDVGALATTPVAVNIKVLQAWVSSNTDCSSPVQVFDGGAGTYQNFVGGVTIGSGTIVAGTYPCVIMVMSDQITFTTSAAADGVCDASTEYTIDVCGSNSGGSFTSVDGTTGTCADGDQTVALYLSTASTATNGGASNAFAPPTAGTEATNGFNLGSALVVAGDASNTFIADFASKIDGTNPTCDVQPPNFSFE